MRIINKCGEEARPAFNLAAFEASLKPGDVFYRKSKFAESGNWALMRTQGVNGTPKYIALATGCATSVLERDYEYFLASDATMVLNIKD